MVPHIISGRHTGSRRWPQTQHVQTFQLISKEKQELLETASDGLHHFRLSKVKICSCLSVNNSYLWISIWSWSPGLTLHHSPEGLHRLPHLKIHKHISQCGDLSFNGDWRKHCVFGGGGIERDCYCNRHRDSWLFIPKSMLVSMLARSSVSTTKWFMFSYPNSGRSAFEALAAAAILQTHTKISK